MEKLPRGVLWLVVFCVAVLAAAGVTTWVAVRTASAENLRYHASSVVWLNVGLQFVLLAAAIYFAGRLLQTDRRRHAAEARAWHLAELSLLSGGLAHEIRNHLHALQSRIALLRKSTREDEALFPRVEKLDEIVQAMEQIVNDFLTFARPAADEPEDIDVAAIIQSVADFESIDLDRNNIQLEFDLQPGVHLLVDRLRFQRALLNLIVNARQAMPKGGTLRIECRQTRGNVRIVVRDTGHGIDPAHLPHVFDTYFTTKPEGSGLGLAIVRRTIEDFGGQVHCTSRVGQGTAFTMELPLAGENERMLAGPKEQLTVSHADGTS